jgi:hypothetical protein
VRRKMLESRRKPVAGRVSLFCKVQLRSAEDEAVVEGRAGELADFGFGETDFGFGGPISVSAL